MKQDAKGNLLGGATFSITGPFGYDVSVTDNAGLDADPVAGQFLLEDLKLGTYTVTETAAPAGYILDPASQDGNLTQAAPDATIARPSSTRWASCSGPRTRATTPGRRSAAQRSASRPTRSPGPAR